MPLLTMLAAAAVTSGIDRAAKTMPASVAAAARLVARETARPPSLRKPLLGVRRERFAGGWVWIVDAGRMDDSALCGTGGCILQLWIVRSDGGVVRRFDERVLDYTIVDRASRRPSLQVGYHGSHCGGSGNLPCRVTYRWTPDRRRPPGRFSKSGGTPS